MAHAHADIYSADPKVRVNSAEEIEIGFGAFRLAMTPGEARALSRDLLLASASAEAGYTTEVSA